MRSINKTNNSVELSENLIFQLTDILGSDNISTDPADCILYGYDHSCLAAPANMITYPKTALQVQKIIQLANHFQINIIPRGQATNTTGAVVPLDGGIVISTEKFNKIKEINYKDRYAIIEPGVINHDLQTALTAYNLFWPPDPTSSKICTIGGNIACNAAGPSAVKYGVTRDHVLGLTFISGDGKLIKTGVCTTKGVVGYDFTRLLIGSEGTLGFITEAILKLSPAPKSTFTIRAYYKSIEDATEIITRIMQHEIIPSALELLDENCIKLLKDNNNIELPADSKAILLIEVNTGYPNDINSILNIAQKLSITHQVAYESADRQHLWQVRKALSPKLRYIAPKKINEDIVVPISKLPQLIYYLNKLSEQYNIPIVNFGHAGNGNIHVNILIDPTNLTQKIAADNILDQIFNKVIALSGTISGEHGIGFIKSQFVSKELEQVNIELMKQIKSIFDPNNILNPSHLANY